MPPIDSAIESTVECTVEPTIKPIVETAFESIVESTLPRKLSQSTPKAYALYCGALGHWVDTDMLGVGIEKLGALDIGSLEQ